MLLGVLSGCIMATKVTNVKPGVGWWIILPLTVWWIYLADHLIDGFRLKENTQNHRHLFFYQNRKIFVLILCLISLVDLIFIWVYLPLQMILFGGIAGTLVLLYLAGVKFLKTRKFIFFPKELFVAFLYVIGIWGGPMIIVSGFSDFVVPIFGYFMVTLSNLFIYSLFEKELDYNDGQTTFILAFGKEKALKIMYSWFLFSFLLNACMVIVVQPGSLIFYSMIILTAMQIAQVFLVYKASWFYMHNRYRWLNEGIFLLPSLMILLR